jgi:NAD(P)-dependent dehydrogenase (short-subunit alcohol dehydrogenase family)
MPFQPPLESGAIDISVQETHVGRFDGRVALVTGAGGGIGGATAERLAADGAAVVLLDINLPAAEHRSSVITEAGGTATAVLADVTDEASLRHAVNRTISEFGGIDFLVNDAYYGSPDDTDVVATPQESWDRVYDVNIMGYVRCCRVVVPHLIERGGGAIVNLSSGAALWAERTRIAYGTSKAAIAALTRNLAVQHGQDGIRANAVAPGFIATETVLKNLNHDEAWLERIGRRAPLGRVGRPAEMAAVICFLLSDDASFITGQTISADGGRIIAESGGGDEVPTRRD